MAESPSLLLQRAADTLERLSDLTTQGEWQARAHPHAPDKANVVIEVAQQTGGFVASLFNSSCCNGNCYGHVEHGDDAVWIAAMSPAVVAPLVAWLRYAQAMYEMVYRRARAARVTVVADNHVSESDRCALNFARLIVGEPRRD